MKQKTDALAELREMVSVWPEALAEYERLGPRFAAISNHADLIAPAYARYLMNQLRERFGFEGVPVRISFRDKRKKLLYTKKAED